jgi:fimbrial chaperone protein
MSRRLEPRGRALIGLAVWLASGALAVAGSFSVVPARLALTPQRPVAALSVHNDGDAPTVVQLETAGWTQSDGRDVYSPSAEVLATPPIFTIPPHGSQLVRVGLRRPLDPNRELTYRVFLQEVPPPPPPDFKGLRVALRFGVPIFVAPPPSSNAKREQPATAVHWHLVHGVDGPTLHAANSGFQHVEVTSLQLTSSATVTPMSRQVQQYLLAGQEFTWPLPTLPAGTGTIHLHATSDGGAIEADLVAETP